jgi:hypothetical protein
MAWQYKIAAVTFKNLSKEGKVKIQSSIKCPLEFIKIKNLLPGKHPPIFPASGKYILRSNLLFWPEHPGGDATIFCCKF